MYVLGVFFVLPLHYDIVLWLVGCYPDVGGLLLYAIVVCCHP